MPLVSVVIPCYNEQNTIHLLLDALYAQTYPRNEMEVIIADGLSTDHTLERIHAFQAQHTDLCVVVVENKRRNIPAGVNRAIEAARGDYIVRLDAHSTPYPDYLTRCVTALEQGMGDNVGGVWEIQPGGDGWLARSIATAAAHRLGVGDAHYRYGDRARIVDTVPFGSFHRVLIDRVGPFDETLLTNEDYEFNTRLRQSGGKVWLDPAIRSRYYARATLSALARQYWRYGYWKARMLRRYPETVRWRQALPPLFVLSLLVFSLLALWIPLARWMLVIELVLYLLVLSAAGIHVALKKKDFTLAFGVPLAIAIMHITWGGAFLWSLLRQDG